jgi:hypothetical protein
MTRNNKNGRHLPGASKDAKACAPAAPSGPAAPARRAEAKLELPIGEPDLEALRSATREWLVPVLVEKFLREQGMHSRFQLENTVCVCQFIDTEGGTGTTRTAGGDASGGTVCRSRQKRPAECHRTRKTTTEP